MFIFLTLLNDVFKTYLDSIKRDLGEKGFTMIFMLALLSWAGIVIILWLLVRGEFQMPTDPLFYACWFGLAFLTEMSFTLFLLGLLNTTFFAASSFGNISFVITAICAALLLGERYTLIQIGAIAMTAIGALVLLKRKVANNAVKWDKGLLLVLSSLLMTPVEFLLYKSATLYAGSYHQFLTGRLAMDTVFYTFFALIVSLLWSRKNPLPRIVSFTSSGLGIAFLFGTMAAELLESWIIFNIPISLFTMLGTLSIPAAYFIGRNKYNELYTWQHILGAALIVLGVILFAVRS